MKRLRERTEMPYDNATIGELLKAPITTRLQVVKSLLLSMAYEEGFSLFAKGHLREMITTLGGILDLMEYREKSR